MKLVSSKVDGMTLRRRHFIKTIARLTLSGLDDTQISIALGITPDYVRVNRQTPLYHSIWTEVSTGNITQLDNGLRLQQETFVEEVKSMVPLALLAIEDALHDKNNPRIRFEAAKQVLDREGTTAIVSKSQVTHKGEIDFSQHDKTAGDLLDSLKSIASSVGSDGPPAPIPGSDLFKNSSYNNSAQQDRMTEQINLADFEMPKNAPVQ